MLRNTESMASTIINVFLLVMTYTELMFFLAFGYILIFSMFGIKHM